MLLHILRHYTESIVRHWKLETTTHCVVFQSFVLYFNALHCISTLCTVFQSIALWAPRRQLPPEVAVSLNLSAPEQTNLCKNGQQTICRTNTDPQEAETAEIIVSFIEMHMQRIFSYCLLAHGQNLMQNTSENNMITQNGREQNFLELEIRCFNVNN